MKGKKVLYITHYSALYGANLSMLNLIIELRDKKQIIPYVLLNEPGDMTIELEKYCINYIIDKYYNCTIDIRRSGVLLKRWLKKFLRFVMYKFVINRLKQYNFDLIHSNSSVVDIGYFAAKKIDCPHIWHVREYGRDDYDLVQIDSFKKVKKRYQHSACIIPVSKSVEEMIRNIDKGLNISMVYNGIKIPDIYDKKYCCDGRFHFCMVGVITRKKNQLEAVKAVKILVERGHKNFVLHIVGEDFNGEIEVIQAFIQKENLKNYVEFAGYKSDISLYLKKMDVGIVASYKEAFGRVTIEYMSNYMPVIGTDTGGTSELIQEGITGFLYKTGKPDLLAEKMALIMSKENMLKAIGVKARMYSESFTVENNAEQVGRVYQTVLGQREG